MYGIETEDWGISMMEEGIEWFEESIKVYIYTDDRKKEQTKDKFKTVKWSEVKVNRKNIILKP